MKTKSQQLHTRIMRRVYYAFARRIITSQITMQIAIFALALFAFAKLVFVRSVIDNMLATQVENLPAFMIGAVSQSEVITLITIGVMLFVLLSLPLQVWSMFSPKFSTATRVHT